MLICGRGLCQVEIAQVWCQKQVYLEPRPGAKDTWPWRVLRVELATTGGEGAGWPPETIVHLRDRHILCGRACKLPTQETPLCFGAKEAEATFLSYLLQPPGWISRRRWSDRFTPHLLGTSSHLVSSASIVHSVYLTFSQSLGTPVSIYFSDLQTGFQFRLSWGRFLYLPLEGGTQCSAPRPPCPLLGGQPGLRPPPSPSGCYLVKLLSRWFSQDTRAFLEGYRIKQEELVTGRGSVVWGFPPLPTLSPHG